MAAKRIDPWKIQRKSNKVRIIFDMKRALRRHQTRMFQYERAKRAAQTMFSKN
jgi:hypothetical protein